MQTGHRIARVLAGIVLAGHLIAGIAAVILLPHGFPLTDIHLWSNTVIPPAAAIVTVVVLVRFFFFRSWALAMGALIAAAAGGWMSAVVSGVVLFPISMTLGRSAAAAGVALAILALAVWARERTALTVGGLTGGAALGVVVILAQRAPSPSTRPAGGTLAEMRGESTVDDAAAGQIVVACGKGKLRLNPLLSFLSRSPDRTWTLLAPEGELGPRRSLTHYAKTPTGFRASYKDDGMTTLIATKDKNGLGLDIDAVSTLPEAVYSHLNTWTAIHITFDAALSFGPTGAVRFPIEPSDYPTGRPSQLAYLGADLTFRVVRARDAEKGPFTELAKGRLLREEPLTLEIRPADDKDKGCRLVFKDWSAQVSTEPSPTAGWGVPQNSVQFFGRGGEGLVVLTLAETGPGRGFDSVGHTEGTYRNRLRVEPIR